MKNLKTYLSVFVVAMLFATGLKNHKAVGAR